MNNSIIFKAIYILLFFICNGLTAQHDTILFNNYDQIIGEIKSMDKGVLKVETPYSKNDFEIEWKEVKQVKSMSHFLISMEDGTRFYSTIYSLNDSISRALTSNNDYIVVRTSEIVYLNIYEDKFKDRLDASIDFGFDLAKAKNLKTFSTRSFIGYKAEKWSADATYNRIQTNQDNTDPIQRSDGSLNFRYNLPRKWYTITTISALSNTEQKLDLRYNAQQGLGLFFIRNNTAYWGGKLGANRNIEEYSNETPDKSSWEIFIGSELNLYDIGDLGLIINVMTYPSITDSGRFRADIGADLKYDLPLNLYIRLGTSINYDNQPAQNASELDYVIQSGFGWEW